MATVPHFKKPTWKDEFTGTSGDPPDWNKWTRWNGHWMPSQSAYFTNRADNIALDGSGRLQLIAKVEDYSSHSYTTGGTYTLYSTEEYSFQYGRIRIRAKIPKSQGIWPAIVMEGITSETVGWPDCGEIDICEVLGSDPDKMYCTIHGVTESDAHWSHQVEYNAPADLSLDYHIYGCNWRANVIEITFDNSIIATFTSSMLNAGEIWPFNAEMYPMLMLMVGGAWGGEPDGTTSWPATMLIDYVKVYE